MVSLDLSLDQNFGPPLPRADFSQNQITSSLGPREEPMENEVD